MRRVQFFIKFGCWYVHSCGGVSVCRWVWMWMDVWIRNILNTQKGKQDQILRKLKRRVSPWVREDESWTHPLPSIWLNGTGLHSRTPALLELLCIYVHLSKLGCLYYFCICYIIKRACDILTKRGTLSSHKSWF